MAKARQQQEFSKVYKSALECKFHGISVNNLLTVIYNTPNAEIAMEMVLGIYEQPEIEQVVCSEKGVKYTFESYNVFDQEVRYSYSKNKSINIYVGKDVDKTQITHENYQEFRRSWNSNETESFDVVFPEMETIYTEMSLSAWEKCQKWQNSQVDTVEYCLED